MYRFIYFWLLFPCFFTWVFNANAQYTNWSYQKKVVVTNNTASGLTDMQVPIAVNTQTLIAQGKLQASGEDLRFAEDIFGNNPVNYWIESGVNTANTKVWLKVPSIPANDSVDIYMFYGNPSASAASNGNSTFALFDDFNGSVNDFSSNCGNTSTAFSSGKVTMSWTSSGMYVSNNSFPTSEIYTAEADVNAKTGNWPAINWRTVSNAQGYSLITSPGGVRIAISNGINNFCSSESFASGTFNSYSGSAYQGIWKHTWVATGNIESEFPTIGVISSTDNTHTRSGNLKLSFGGVQSGSGSITMNWIRVRKYASQMPTTRITSACNPTIAGAIDGPASTCSSAPVDTIKATGSTTGGDGNYFYRWQDSTAGSSWANISNANDTFYHPGPLTKTTGYRRIDSSNCGVDTTNSVTILVNPKPAVAFNTPTACFGDSFQFTNATTISAGTVSGWNWGFGDGNSANIENPAHLYFTPGKYDVQLIATSDSGCIDSTTQQVTIPKPLNGGNVGLASSAYNGNSVALQYSESFTNGVTYIPGTDQHDNWITFRNSLDTNDYVYNSLRMKGNLNKTGVTCLDTLAIANIIQALSEGNTATVTCNGTKWRVGTCGNGIELNANNSGFACQCGSGPIIRPTIGVNANWGGISSPTCSAPSQTMKVELKSPVGHKDSTILCSGTAPDSLINEITAGGGQTFNYQWFDSTKGGSWATVSGTNNLEFYLPSAVNETTWFRRAAIDPGCGDTSWSNVLKVNVYKPLIAGTLNGVASICPNDTPNLITESVEATGSNGRYSHSWQDSTKGGSWTSIAGADTTFYQPGPLTETTWFRRIDSAICGADTTNTVQVTVDPVPKAAFGVENLCYGDTAQFLDSSTISAGNVNQWDWDFGDGNNASIENPKHFYNSAGTYNVQLIATSQSGALASKGCADTITKPITIHPKPAAGYTVTEACFSDSTAFTNTSSIGTGSITSYNYDFGDGNSSNKKDPKHLYATAGNYPTKLIVTSDQSCRDTAQQQVPVHPLPVASFSFQNECDQDTVSFTNNSSGATSYTWDFGDNNSSNTTNPKKVYASPGAYEVVLTATTAKNCVDKDTQTVVIHPVPVADFTTNNVCFGDTANFTNTSTISSGNINFHWDFDDGTSNVTDTSPNYLYSSPGNYDVQLIVTSDKSCQDTTTKAVEIYPLPTVNLSFVNQCTNDTVAFTNTTTGAVNFSWDFGDGNTSSKAEPDHVYKKPGSYMVSLVATSVEGCIDSSSKAISIYALPKARFTTANECVYDTLKFSDSSTLASGAIINWDWRFGDGNTANTQQAAHLYANSGAYNVQLITTSNQGCKDTATETIWAHPAPMVKFGQTTACKLEATYFTDSSTISSGKMTGFAWDFGDGGLSGKRNPAYIYNNAGTYTVTLEVTSDSGCMDTITKPVNVNVLPTAAFSTANVCLDDTAVFTNNSQIPAGTVTYQWQFGDNQSSTQPNPDHVYALPGFYAVTLVVTSDKGCKDSITKQIQVYPAPVSTFSAGNVCLSDTLNFRNQSAAASTYNWDFGDNSTATNPNPSHLYTSSGKYTVSLIATSANGCKDTTEQQVTVYNLPLADFSAKDVCFGQSMGFNNKTSNAVSYTWDFGEGSSSSNTNPNHTYTAAGNYFVSLIAESANGCLDTIEKQVTVDPLPKTQFTFQDVCDKDTVDFINQTVGETGFSWDFGDNTTSKVENPDKVYASPGSYQVVLTATAAGCVAIDSQTVTIHPKPVSAFSTSNVCEGKPMLFNNLSTISSGNLGYFWEFGDGSGTSSNASPNYTYSNAGNYNVTLVTTSGKSCTDTLQKPVRVFDLPVTAFSFSNACTNDTIGFTNTTSGAANYQWDFGDGATSTNLSPDHVYTAPGTYTVTLTATSPDNCKKSLSKNITIYGLPVAAFSTRDECFNDTVLFNNQSSGASAYDWHFGDGVTSKASDPAHLYTNPGSYNVTLISNSSFGCKDTTIKSVDIYRLPVSNFTQLDVCDGKAMTFNNTSRNAASFAWDFGDGSSSLNNAPQHTYPDSGTYTVTLISETGNGCLDTLQKAVAVNPLPSVNWLTTNKCVYDSITFTDASRRGNAYTWFMGDGNTVNQASFNYKYSNAGNYQVKLRVATNDGCVDSLSRNVTAYPKPKALFTQEDVCNNEPMRFTNASQGTINSYEWDFGDGNTSLQRDPVHVFNMADSNQTVSLIVTSNQGCRDTASQPVHIHPVPKPDFTVENACMEQPAKFKDSSSVAWGQITGYDWDLGNGKANKQPIAARTFPARGQYPISLTVTTDFGCQASTDRIVDIYPLPQADFNWRAICFGKPMPFNNTSTIATGAIVEYQWQFGDGGTSGQVNPAHTYLSDGSFEPLLVATSDLGCKDTVTYPVEVYAKPDADFTTEKVCHGSMTEFTNNSAVASSYRWDFGDGTGSSTLSEPFYQYLNPGDFSVTLIAANNKNCRDTATQRVVVAPLPVADFSIQGVCIGAEVQPEDASLGDIAEWEWDFGQGIRKTGQIAEHAYEKPGRQVVALTVANTDGCFDSVERSVEVYQAPEMGISADTTVSLGVPIQLVAEGGDTYSWSPSAGLSDPFTHDPLATPLENTTYQVMITTPNGCSDDTTVTVNVTEDVVLQPTNLITPNGNGRNDAWNIGNIENYQDCEVVVFNQWGKEVYRKRGYQNDWQGTHNGDTLPDGTYYYIILCGERDYKGAVTILRNKKN